MSRIADAEAELDEARHQGGIGVRRGVVMDVTGMGNEVVGLGRGEAEGAARLVPVVGDKGRGEPAGRCKMVGVGGRLIKGEARIDQVGIAVGGGDVTPLPCAPGLAQATGVPQAL